MANKPFDYTVINPLERPTSSDLNQLQGEAHADSRFLAQELFYTLNGISNGPTDGVFPQAFIVSPTAPASLAVELAGGLGYQTGAAETAIGGIAGLNDDFTYKAIYLSQTTTISIPSLPTTGNHRYDLIQVRALTGPERLTDSTVTDIYNPSLNSFGAASKYKTLTTDLAGQTVQVLPAATPATQPLSYKVGVEAPLAGPPPAPTADAGYLPIALILVTDTTTSIVAGDITDQRPLLKFPDALVPSSLASFGDPGSVVWSNGTALEVTAQGNSGYLLKSNGAAAPSWLSTVPVVNGGTGFNSYTQGNLLYANSSVSLQKIAPGTTSQILRGGTAPSWGTVPAGAFASNTVPVSAIQYRSSFQTISGGPLVVPSGGYTDIATLTADFERGNLQVGVMPLTTGAEMAAYLVSNPVAGPAASVRIRYTITGSFGVYATYVQLHTFGQNTGTTLEWSIPFAIVNCPLTTLDSYTITVAVWPILTGDTASFSNYQLRAWQG